MVAIRVKVMSALFQIISMGHSSASK